MQNIISTRKFPFFDIIEGENFINNDNQINEIPISQENKLNDKNEKKEESNINISEISPNQMCAINGIIFICGKVKYKMNEKSIFEYLIVKIINNKVIDQYRLHNKLYFDFQIKVFNNSPYFVSVGGDLEDSINENEKNKNFITSIKIYDISSLIRNPIKKINNKNGDIENLLAKQIKLKNIKIEEKNKNENIINIENIKSFAISSDFSQCAIGLENGEIILIIGKPNILSCSPKETYIKKLNQMEKKLEITNLIFSNEKKENNILYVTTNEGLYYYYFDQNNNETIQEKSLSENEGGAYNGCVDVKDDKFIIASNINSLIIEFIGGVKGSSKYFDGKRKSIKYFKNYIVFISLKENNNSLEIYDPENQFFIYSNENFKNISSICTDNEYIYAFIENKNNDKKFIIKLKEKDNKDKFEIFFKKHLYEIALSYAQKLNYDDDKISQISQRCAEYSYLKGDFDKSISQYINTINFLEPSNVIQKFLEKSKLDYLIQYLEALEANKQFQERDNEELKDYTSLLLNCYIMQEKFVKIKEFIEKNKILPKRIIKSAINVCLETENIDLALQIAKQNNLIEDVLRILIEKQGKYEKALDVIQPEKKVKDQLIISIDDKIYFFCKFSKFFLENKNMRESFYLKINQFIDENISKIEYNNIVKLVKMFFGYNKYFKSLFNKLESLNIKDNELNNYKDEENDINNEINKEEEKDKNKELNKDEEKDKNIKEKKDENKHINKIRELNNKSFQNLIHKIIELYLDDDISQRYKILDILKKYKNIYNKTYVLMLFKEKQYIEGEIELLNSNKEKNQIELLSIYMDRRDYKEIISLCTNNGNSDKIYLDLALNYFSSPENRIPKKEENEKEIIEEMDKYLQILLDNIIENKSMIPGHVLDILKKSNPDIPFKLIKQFIQKSIQKEVIPLEKSKENIDKLKNDLLKTEKEINELKTNYYTLISKICPECGLQISLPAIYFLCHHTYHSLCLNSINIDNNLECMKCKDKRIKLLNSMKNSRNIIYKKDLFDKEIKINGIFSIYGNGIMGLKSLKNDNFLENREENDDNQKIKNDNNYTTKNN